MARLQDVIGYGTHAARPAAGSAGALYYETDTGLLLRDNGATWDALGPETTKGDLLVFDGGSLKRLPVGADSQVLTADSAQATGVKWAAAGAGGAMTQIAQVVLGSAAAAIDFTGIAGAYNHLLVVCIARSDFATGSQSELHVQLNGDTGAHYDSWTADGTNDGATSWRLSNMSTDQNVAGPNLALQFLLPFYAQTNFYKNVTGTGIFTTGNGASDNVRNFGGQWRSTAAITSLHLYPANGNFKAGCAATLYGLA